MSQGREELIVGQFTVLHGTATGQWAKDADSEAFVIDVGEVFVVTPGATEGSFNSPFRGGEKVIDSKQRRAFFGDALGVAHVGKRSEMADRVAELNPWRSLGRFGSGEEGIPGKSLLANRDLPRPYKNEASRSGARIEFVSDLGDFSLLHEFSSAQNFLPTHVAVVMQDRELHVETIEAIEVKNVGWFPKLLIAYERGQGTDLLISCLRMEIDDFEYRVPTAEELTFTTFAAYQLHGPSVIPREEMASVVGGIAIGPDVLDGLTDAVDKRAAYGLVEASPAGRYRSWLFALASIVLFIMTYCFLLKKVKVRQ